MRYEDINIGDKVIANGWRNDGADHEYGTNSTIERWVSEATTLVVKDLYSPGLGFDFEVSDGDRTFTLHHSELSSATEDNQVTLAPGDYVSTAGMTEDQYHAVARAFANAGCPRFGGDAAGKGKGDYLEWFYDELVSTDFAEPGARHLTISQVLSATNAGNKEEDMTPCEKLGYKVGDVFEYTGDGAFPKAGKIRLSEDDGTRHPAFHGIDCKANDGDDWSYANVEAVRRIDGTTDPLTTTLEQAADHDTKAKHHAAEHDRLMQQARDMLPDGWMLVRGGVDWAKGEDMTDPANWREGDIIRYDADDRLFLTAGSQYVVQSSNLDSDGDVEVLDDDGDIAFAETSNCTWVRRPT